MSESEERILSVKDGGIAWLTFNNPAKRNAISLEMWERIHECVRDYESDDEVRVVVISGMGDKAFASGADISQFEEKRSNAEAAEKYAKVSQSAREGLGHMRKPVIAMVRGYCLGGGLALALKADIRIASTNAQFGIPAARLGLAYSFDSLKALSDVVGISIAKEFLFTARRFTADEALGAGLVNRVVELGQLEEVVREYARMIAANAPLSVKSAKFILNEIPKDPEKRNLKAIEESIRQCMDSSDYAEGRRAFMEKRVANFTGR